MLIQQNTAEKVLRSKTGNYGDTVHDRYSSLTPQKTLLLLLEVLFECNTLAKPAGLLASESFKHWIKSKCVVWIFNDFKTAL